MLALYCVLRCIILLTDLVGILLLTSSGTRNLHVFVTELLSKMAAAAANRKYKIFNEV